MLQLLKPVPGAILVVLLLYGCNGASSVPQTAPFWLAREWRVAGVLCPENCSAIVRDLVAEHIDQPVVITAKEFDNPFTETCRERPNYTAVMQKAASDFLQALPPARQGAPTFQAAPLGVKPETIVQAGLVTCDGENGNPVATVLFVDQQKGFFFFEEGSFIELKAAQ